MLHQLAPHAHHQHEINALSDYQADEHEGISHDHHSDEESSLDFFSKLFANHAHYQQLLNNSPSQVQLSENHNNKNRELKTIVTLFQVTIDEVFLILKQPIPESLGIYKNTYFFSLALRGPPTLG
ncbi:hypothetical protein LV84_02133 [Algoriphagus ratkowskyi]|uniref:Uncharacterized protein n=1 Tax=Algoriphagus ratkowskyi TaxID=57028 RepID=A0A2W7T1D1_9BACT|nr:hypothetical protein [Algoriphagus ratkowskyi]PZX57002.1 hypothetical protein LV84_02133 [Algoriphagus ratkowskyi]TXD79906.1 hypothetical protein ESW18_01880 [Algoriphagus ratkowskyi]